MSTFTEATVEVSAQLVRESDGGHMYVTAISYAADGQRVRRATFDVDLTTTQRTQIGNLLTRAEDAAKQRWSIP